MEPTVSVLGLRAVAFGAAARGFAIEDLCKRFDIDPKLIEDVDGRVPARMMVPIWNELPELVGDPDFGLHLGEGLAAHGPSLLFHLVRASRTLGEGMLRLHASWRVMNDVHPAEYKVEGTRSILRMRTNHTAIPSPR